MDKKIKKPELLCPAGNLETLKVAIDYGADAVYIGGEKYGLRAKADNFSIEDMKAGAIYAHEHNAKLYVTCNIFAHNDDIEGVKEYFGRLKAAGMEEYIDAFIISDLGIMALAKEILPGIEIHVSTQMNNTNYMTYNAWHKMGATRVVAARELSLKEIRTIKDNIDEDLEIEAFMHGAMCISYSGRCLLSSYFTGRDANKGACTHPCRWKYAIVEEKRPGEYLPVEEDERGTYIFNSKDLCMIEYVPEMVKAGIDSFKIEGRMKTALYVAVVAKTYRKAIDDYFESEEKYRANIDSYKKEIAECTFRQFTTGFYFRKPDHEMQVYDNNVYQRNAIYLSLVESVDEANNNFMLHQKNKFSVGDTIEFMTFSGDNVSAEVLEITDDKGRSQESAPHPGQEVYIKIDDVSQIKPGMIVRMMSEEKDISLE